MRLGLVLKNHRMHERKSLRQLGEEIGISAVTILRIESGKHCDIPSFGKLLTWLMNEEKEPS
jgi:transcriptional regulator with XRE-family HTH domain